MDFRALDLNLLLVFDALFQAQSTTAVARKLSISQPTVSNSLKKLREFFADELFVRSAYGMQPTPKARELHGAVAQMIRIIDAEIVSAPQFDPLTSARAFVINTTDIGEMVFVPPLLRRLREFAPKASIECVCLDPAELAQNMRQGAVDLAIGYLPELNGGSISVQGLFEHPFVCLLGAEHPEVHDGMTLAHYAAANHIALTGEGHNQRKFEEVIERAVPERRVSFRSRNFMNIPFIVRDTDLIATVPKVIAVAFAHLPGLRAVKPPLEIPRIPIKQYWHQRVAQDEAQIWLRRRVSELFLNSDPTREFRIPG